MFILLKASISFGLLFALWTHLEGASLSRSLAQLSWGHAAAAVLVLIAQTPVLALRWLLIVQLLGGKADFAHLARVTWVGLFFNQALPASIGGDVIRSWEGCRAGLGLRTAVNSVVLERVTGLFTLVLIVACALPMLWDRLADFPMLRTLLAALLPAILGGLVGLFLLRHVPRRHFQRPVMQPLRALAADLGQVARAPGVVLALVLLGLISNSLAIAAAYVIGLGLGLQVALPFYIGLVPAAILATIVPISIAGWGVREGAMVILFVSVGADAQRTLTLSVIFGVALLIASLPGGFLWLFWRGSSRPL